jgi:hypothetical protein
MKALPQLVIDQTLSEFRSKKVLLIRDFGQLMKASKPTISRYIKKWKTYSSYNFNGAYYTLQDIPEFDHNGLWVYKGVRFSMHGNLTRTIQYLVENSSCGMTMGQLRLILDSVLHSFLPKMVAGDLLFRKKYDGVYVYFTNDPDLRNAQIQHLVKMRFRQKSAISCETAIKILVSRIQYPKLDFGQFVNKLQEQGIKQDASELSAFFEFHGIEKKTPDFH